MRRRHWSWADRAGWTQKTVEITVVPDSEAPKVDLRMSATSVTQGTGVGFVVWAVDNVGIAERSLAGVPIQLDAKGWGRVVMNTIGQFTVVASATDAAGKQGQFTGTISVSSPDPSLRQVALLAPAKRAVITAPTSVTSSVTDDDLLSWRMEVWTPDGQLMRTLASATSPDGLPIGSVSGSLETFDPTVLRNGPYLLRLVGKQMGGQEATAERFVEVAGRFKLGNFNLAFTDLSIPVSGFPITITRTYDTLRAHRAGDFGYGWRLSTGDMKAAVEYAPGPMSEFSVLPPFRDGTRVTITREDGSTKGFTFQPIEIPFLTISFSSPTWRLTPE